MFQTLRTRAFRPTKMARFLTSKSDATTQAPFQSINLHKPYIQKKDPGKPILDTSLYPVQPNTRMKALVKTAPEVGMQLRDQNVPVCGPDDILIKVKKAAICGTDLHIWNWDEWSQRTVPTPMTIGHEFYGVVEEVGSNVKGFNKGDRATGEGHITCGFCRNCRGGRTHLCRATIGLGVNRPGCFAEYVSLPATNVFPVHPDIPDEIASFMDPIGNAVHSCLSFDLVGEDVLITGAGPIGVVCAAICKQVGARHVVVCDINDYRLNLAMQCGATAVVNVSDNASDRLSHAVFNELGMKEGFDIGLEMSGNRLAMGNMLKHMNHGGRISVLGIPPNPFEINWDDVIFKGLILKGIYGREMFETWYKMQNLLTSGLSETIAPVLTHILPMDDYQQCFEACASSTSGKVIMDVD